MIKLTCLLVLVGVLFARSNGQWPLGQSFYSSMNQMSANLDNMAVDMQVANMERQALLSEDMKLSWEGVPFGPGGSVFITRDGGLGYAYNATDGSYTLYSISSKSPPTGYRYHITAQGGTSFTSW